MITKGRKGHVFVAMCGQKLKSFLLVPESRRVPRVSCTVEVPLEASCEQKHRGLEMPGVLEGHPQGEYKGEAVGPSCQRWFHGSKEEHKTVFRAEWEPCWTELLELPGGKTPCQRVLENHLQALVAVAGPRLMVENRRDCSMHKESHGSGNAWADWGMTKSDPWFPALLPLLLWLVCLDVSSAHYVPGTVLRGTRIFSFNLHILNEVDPILASMYRWRDGGSGR